MSRAFTLLSGLLAAALVLAATTSEARSVGWRGDGTGRYDASKVPRAWSADAVRWKADLPAWGNASPLVVGDRVYVTSEPTDLHAFRASDGKRLWTRSSEYAHTLPPTEAADAAARTAEAERLAKALAEAKRTRGKLLRAARRTTSDDAARATRQRELDEATRHMNALKEALDDLALYRLAPRGDAIGYASSTPVSDGRAVYTLFGQGVMAAYSPDGVRKWARWLGRPHLPMRGNPDGHAASPLLVDGVLVAPLRLLQGLDPATGDTLWQGRAYDHFGTPAALRVGGVGAVATPDGAVYRARDGALLGRVDAPPLFYVGPVADSARLYMAGSTSSSSGDHRSVALAFDLAGLSHGQPPAEPIWRRALGRHPIYATPLVHEGLLYVLDASGWLTLLDAATGEERARLNLDFGVASASPGLADGWVWFRDEDGEVLGGPRGEGFTPSARTRLGSGRSTPFFSGSRVFVRDADALYCVGP